MSEYKYYDDGAAWLDTYLWPAVVRVLDEHAPPPARVFDLGCGNGASSRRLASRGYDVTGVDPSESGIRIASEHKAENLRFAVGSTNEDLRQRFGTFDLVLSLEVIEHCPSALQFASTLRSLVRPGGLALVSTPYHSYFKNAVLALAGRFDRHFNPLWEGGHLRFFSVATLTKLLSSCGFEDIRIFRAGRIPLLAKSMLALARRKMECESSC